MTLAMHSQTKTAIYNVYKYFRDRKLGPTREHRGDVAARVAAAVGVPHQTIMRIVNEADRIQATYGMVIFEDPLNKRRPEIIDLDTAIRDKFIEFIKRKETPTVNKIRTELLDDGVLLCSYDYMKLQLKRLGYKFRPARPRMRRKVPSVKVEAAAGTSSEGLLLEHITVKLEPMEPGHHYVEVDIPPPLLTTSTNDLECDVHIKVEQHEFIDDD